MAHSPSPAKWLPTEEAVDTLLAHRIAGFRVLEGDVRLYWRRTWKAPWEHHDELHRKYSEHHMELRELAIPGIVLSRPKEHSSFEIFSHSLDATTQFQAALAAGMNRPFLAFRIAENVAKTLRGLHGAGYAFGGFHPSQVRLGLKGMALLLDFAGERIVQEVEGVDSLPPSPYRAPEITQGVLAQKESDIFGLGAWLYEMLTAGPFQHDRFSETSFIDLMVRVGVTEGTGSELLTLLNGMLHSDPSRRYPDAGTLLGVFHRLLDSDFAGFAYDDFADRFEGLLGEKLYAQGQEFVAFAKQRKIDFGLPLELSKYPFRNPEDSDFVSPQILALQQELASIDEGSVSTPPKPMKMGAPAPSHTAFKETSEAYTLEEAEASRDFLEEYNASETTVDSARFFQPLETPSSDVKEPDLSHRHLTPKAPVPLFAQSLLELEVAEKTQPPSPVIRALHKTLSLILGLAVLTGTGWFYLTAHQRNVMEQTGDRAFLLGDYQEAIAAWEVALTKSPEDEALKYKVVEAKKMEAAGEQRTEEVSSKEGSGTGDQEPGIQSQKLADKTRQRRESSRK